MKARPRYAERRVAELLSEFFVSIGAMPVYRVPVLGKTGPDLTVNELQLIVDVKSRIEVPVSYICAQPCIHGRLICIPLGLVHESLVGNPISVDVEFLHGKITKTVENYYDHMHEWTQKHRPAGITALVLHRPKLPFGMSQLIIHVTQLPILEERCQKIKSSSIQTMSV